MTRTCTEQISAHHIRALIEKLDYQNCEREVLLRLLLLFARLPVPSDPFGLYPDYADLKNEFLLALNGNDCEPLEESFLKLYCHLHGHEAPYTQTERSCVQKTGGYWCHAGGISPLLKAGKYIGPTTVSGDFGAGNGLQGMLLQKLYPHAKTIQIEISSRMVQAGRHLQQWLGIAPDRIDWIVGNVMESSSMGMNFIYLYRPVRPEGQGQNFYIKLASELRTVRHPVIIFSIADCLRAFLPETFEIFYTDGHLTCYRNSIAKHRPPCTGL